MNKRKLQEFASWAKINLESQIEVSLRAIGINSIADIKISTVKGEITIIEGLEKTYPKKFKEQRDKLVNVIKELGYKNSIEQFAYTWFNRLIALRFMEVHGYLDHGFKIFPTTTNPIPEIFTQIKFVQADLALDLSHAEKLKATNQNEELYRYIMFKQCNALSQPLPMLFSRDQEFLEFLSPSPLLFGETIISKLIEIDEEDFKEDVEIIGWLYQFYVSFNRDKIRNKDKFVKEDIPTLTQIFTPDWIVRYMTENSLGRIWLENHPQSSLGKRMKYYVEEAEQELEVIEKINYLKYKNVEIENIGFIEPACGSGHILVYAFDLFVEMYKEKGYPLKDIPRLILKNNLYGLDIDLRASQLASFALSMRARSIDNRFFEEQRIVYPKILEIIDSKTIQTPRSGKSYFDYLKQFNEQQWKEPNKLTKDDFDEIEYVVDLFSEGKVIGSLLKVNPGNYLTIKEKLIKNEKQTLLDLFALDFIQLGFKELIRLLDLAHVMSVKYDVMVTNPPYLSVSNLDESIKNYAKKHYPNSKSDMFAMFMEVPYIKNSGLRSIVNPDSWMFLKSYEGLRKVKASNEIILNMTHHGMGEFDAVVQTTAFVLRNVAIPKYKGKYYRLINSQQKEKDFLTKTNQFIADGAKFLSISGVIFGYWISSKLERVFKIGKPLSAVCKPTQGLATADNGRFVRFWWELNNLDEYLISASREESIRANKKWVPYNKGGPFRRWYGNNDTVVYFLDFGKEIASSSGSVIRNSKQYFLESATWGKISSSLISFRYKPFGHVFDVAGTSIFGSHKELIYLLGFGNSKVAQHILSVTAPTLNYEVGQISNIPIIVGDINYIYKLVNNCIEITKKDWDSFEVSWEFKKNALITSGRIEEKFITISKEKQNSFSTLKKTEEEINEYFISLYELNNELIKNVEDQHVSISIANKKSDIKFLISYLVGVLLGRFSLLEEGLIFAGGEVDFNRYGNFEVDRDGIIPIFTDLGIQSSLTNRIIKLLKQVYGDTYYRENIDFIAESLGKKNDETSEETLNRYLLEDFYSDHLKTYQKRPIYWMFSSGKKNGFKCLVYLHRYNENTLANINANYFLPATANLSHQIGELDQKRKNAVDSRQQLQIEREIDSLQEQLREAREYGLVLNHMANRFIRIELDDGVKVNYEKFQKIEIMTDNGKVKKDLLVPIK